MNYQYSVNGIKGSAARMYTVVCCHYSVTDVDAVTLYAYAVVCISDVLACYYEYINIGVYTILTFPGTTRVPWVPKASPPPSWQGGVREPSRQDGPLCVPCGGCTNRQIQVKAQNPETVTVQSLLLWDCEIWICFICSLARCGANLTFVRARPVLHERMVKAHVRTWGLRFGRQTSSLQIPKRHSTRKLHCTQFAIQ